MAIPSLHDVFWAELWYNTGCMKNRKKSNRAEPAELDRRLVVDVARLAREGETLEGEVDCVDIDEEFVKPFGGVRYRLKAQLIGQELLVKGVLEQDFTLACSRCGEDFDDTIRVDDFVQSYEIGEKTQEVDLTEDARESIILTLPAYPVCSETCPGIEQKVEMPGDSRWDILDNLKEGEKRNGKS